MVILIKIEYRELDHARSLIATIQYHYKLGPLAGRDHGISHFCIQSLYASNSASYMLYQHTISKGHLTQV